MLIDAINKAVEDNFIEIDKKQKKDYLSEETWNLIKKRDEEMNSETKNNLNKLIKKMRGKTEKIRYWRR